MAPPSLPTPSDPDPRLNSLLNWSAWWVSATTHFTSIGSGSGRRSGLIFWQRSGDERGLCFCRGLFDGMMIPMTNWIGVSVCILAVLGTGCDRSVTQALTVSRKVEISFASDRPVNSSDISNAVQALSERFAAMGMKEVRLLSDDRSVKRMTIEVTGEGELADLTFRHLIETWGTLDFRRVHPDSDLLIESDELFPEPGWKTVTFLELFESSDDETPPRKLVVKNRAEVPAKMDRVHAVYGPVGWEIALKLNGESGERMYEITKDMATDRDRLAIVSDGDKVLSAPVVLSTLRENISISGDFAEEEVYLIVACLKHPLPMPLKLVSFAGAPEVSVSRE